MSTSEALLIIKVLYSSINLGNSCQIKIKLYLFIDELVLHSCFTATENCGLIYVTAVMYSVLINVSLHTLSHVATEHTVIMFLWCFQTNYGTPWVEKYRVKGRGLRLEQVARYGKQILQVTTVSLSLSLSLSSLIYLINNFRKNVYNLLNSMWKWKSKHYLIFTVP